jgi:NADP-dependent 3-hydroxy acid dehydrogenase YdfG
MRRNAMSERKTVLITGGSGGVGGALAKQLATEGWRVFATARDRNAIRPVMGGAGEVIPLALELTDAASVAAAGP